MRRLADFGILVALIFVCSLFICQQAVQMFDFYDMAAFLDAGYRVWQGQKIYVDFFYIAGPIHPYLHALSFKLFGFNKTAILAYLCAEQAVCLSCVFVMARRSLGVGTSATLVLLTCASLFGPIAHPWYDQTAIAFFLVACVAMLWSYPAGNVWRTWALPAVSGGCLALAFLTKTNIGAAGGGMMLLGYLVMSRAAKNFRPLLSYVLGGLFVFAAVLLTLPSRAAYWDQNFVAFGMSDRLSAFFKIEMIFVFHPFISMALAAGLIAGIGGWRWCYAHLPEFTLLVITWVTGAFSAWTGSAIPYSYCFFWGLIALWVFVLAGALPRGKSGTLEGRVWLSINSIKWVAVALMVVFLWPRQLSTWGWQPHNLDGDYAMKAKGFAGWKCRKDIGIGLDAAIDYIDKNVPQTDSLLVMPDCEIVYGITGHDSYRKVPWAFNRENGPGRGSMRTQMLQQFNTHPPDWILLRTEEVIEPLKTREMLMELGMLSEIQENYKIVFVNDFGTVPGFDPLKYQRVEFTVWKRNALGASTKP